MVCHPARRASRGPLKRCAPAPLAGEPLGLRIWALPEPSGPGGERAGEAARPRDSKGKCIAETYETQPPPRRQSNAGPKAGEDGYHFGRARELVRPATTTLPDLPTAAHKSRGGSITPVARAVSARFAQPPISPQGGPAPQTTPTDRPPKGVFPFGESEGRFLLSPQKKAPLRKRLYYG